MNFIISYRDAWKIFWKSFEKSIVEIFSENSGF